MLLLKFSLISAAALVVTVASPVHSVLLLVLTFCCAAALLLYLGVEFLALVYVLVYIGAIAVLFLFIVMMMNLRVHQKEQQYFILYSFVVICLGGELVYSLAGLNSFKILMFLGQCHYYLHNFDNMKLIGVFIYTILPLSVILIGFILLIAMIGAILYTLEHARGIKRQLIFEQNARNRHGALRIL